MRRRRYLVAYDISDPKRLTKVRRKVRGFGDSMQYSVFVCDLDARERSELIDGLLAIIDNRADRVAIVEIGQDGDRAPFFFLGSPPRLPVGGPRIF